MCRDVVLRVGLKIEDYTSNSICTVPGCHVDCAGKKLRNTRIGGSQWTAHGGDVEADSAFVRLRSKTFLLIVSGSSDAPDGF